MQWLSGKYQEHVSKLSWENLKRLFQEKKGHSRKNTENDPKKGGGVNAVKNMFQCNDHQSNTKNIYTNFQGKILKSSQETEENTPNMTPGRGWHAVIFFVVTTEHYQKHQRKKFWENNEWFSRKQKSSKQTVKKLPNN